MEMIATIRQGLTQLLSGAPAAASASPPAAPAAPGGAEPSALAVLLVMAAQADGVFSAAESDALLGVLAAEEQLSPAAAREALRIAETAAQDAIEFYTFAREISHGRPYPERLRLLRLFFRVIGADGVLAHEEEEKLGRIARALEVATVDYGKLKAEARRPRSSG